jgi:hypothetical protein
VREQSCRKRTAGHRFTDIQNYSVLVTSLGLQQHEFLQEDVFGDEDTFAAIIGNHRGIAVTENAREKIHRTHQTRALLEKRVKWQEEPFGPGKSFSGEATLERAGRSKGIILGTDSSGGTPFASPQPLMHPSSRGSTSTRGTGGLAS